MRDKVIAIIPAKANSSRLENKNLLQIGGHPLFMHSVYYALGERIKPIVSTDSQSVIDICERNNINYVKELVDDSNIINCIKGVINNYHDVEYVILLQPTSPMRKEGLLNHILDKMIESKSNCGFTVQDIKLIGVLNNEFVFATRDQDPDTKFFKFFDGNILVTKVDHIKKNNTLFDKHPLTFGNEHPYNLQVDTQSQFNTCKLLIENNPGLSSVGLVKPRKKCVIVSNKTNLKRNYSKFIDSCDVVIRVNRMDNLRTGLTGTKTTDVVVAAYWYYDAFSDEAKKVDVLKQSKVWLINEPRNTGKELIKKYNLQNAQFIPDDYYMKSLNMTTLSVAVALAEGNYFKDCDLYLLGDIDPKVRAPGSTKHPYENELIFYKNLITRGILKPILEEDIKNGEYFYSEPISSQERWKSMEDALKFGADFEIDGYIRVKYPTHVEMFRALNRRVLSQLKLQLGSIFPSGPDELVIEWDSQPMERFRLMEDKTYWLETNQPFSNQQI